MPIDLETPTKRPRRQCECGKSFLVYRPAQRFCSDRCRYKHRYQARATELRELQAENRRLKREAGEPSQPK